MPIYGAGQSASQVNVQIDANQTLLTETEITGSAVSQIDFSGLDINTHKSYRIEFELNNPTGSTVGLALYANGDTTTTNYYTQTHTSSATASTSAATNSASIGNISTNQITAGECLVQLNKLAGSANGSYVAKSSIMRKSNSTQMQNQTNTIFSTSTSISNITQLTLVSAAGGLGIGSKIRIYRGDR